MSDSNQVLAARIYPTAVKEHGSDRFRDFSARRFSLALVSALSLGLPLVAHAASGEFLLDGNDSLALTLQEAIDQPGDHHITLLKNLDIAGGLVVSGKTIHFALDGHDLTLSNAAGAGMQVNGGGAVDYTGAGSFTASSTAGDGLIVEDGNSSAELTGASTNTGAAYAVHANGEVTVTVRGDVAALGALDMGIKAENGAEVNVAGKVTAADASAIVAEHGGTSVTVAGDVQSGGDGNRAIDAFGGATVIVGGVTADGANETDADFVTQAAKASYLALVPWNLRTPPITEPSNFPAALAVSMLKPTLDPVGANNWSCKPSADHPNPVILIHGTWENAYDNWNGLSPILAAQGYCVYALNYGNTTGVLWLNATGDMVASASEVAAFVKKVRAATGAKHVSLIGHSQGGAQARYYANLLAPAGEVTDVIALSASNHPTSLDGIVNLKNALGLDPLVKGVFDLIKMPAAQQQSTNSQFYKNLNGKSETVSGIRYTTIATKFDEVVTPYTQAFIKAVPGAVVDNITIQNICPFDMSEHVSISYDKNVAQVVLNALDPGHQRPIFCYIQLPVFGTTQSVATALGG